MKKLVLFFAFAALAAFPANAQTIVLKKGNAQDLLTTEAGQTFSVTPTSGDLNVTGNVSGCNGSGSGCTEGFEFSYSIDPSPNPGDTINIVSDKFSTPGAAFTAAQGTTFTAGSNAAEIFLNCGGCSNAIGSITLDFNLIIQQVLATVFEIKFTADDLLNTNFDPTQNQEFNIEAFVQSYTDIDALNLAFIESAVAIGMVFAAERDGVMIDLLGVREQDAQQKFEDKRKKFDTTEAGAALLAKRDEFGGETQEYRDARSEYVAHEFQQFLYAITIHDEYRSEQEKAAESGSSSVSESTEAEAQRNSAESDQASDQNLQGQIQRDINEALDAQHLLDMNNGIESVIPELAGIVVIAQAGPAKTYAAADGPATIVTAFADTRK